MAVLSRAALDVHCITYEADFLVGGRVRAATTRDRTTRGRRVALDKAVERSEKVDRFMTPRGSSHLGEVPWIILMEQFWTHARLRQWVKVRGDRQAAWRRRCELRLKDNGADVPRLAESVFHHLRCKRHQQESHSPE